MQNNATHDMELFDLKLILFQLIFLILLVQLNEWNVATSSFISCQLFMTMIVIHQKVPNWCCSVLFIFNSIQFYKNNAWENLHNKVLFNINIWSYCTFSEKFVSCEKDGLLNIDSWMQIFNSCQSSRLRLHPHCQQRMEIIPWTSDHISLEWLGIIRNVMCLEILFKFV